MGKLETNRLEEFVHQHNTQVEFFLAEGLLGLFVPGFISTSFPSYESTRGIFSDEVQLKWDYDNLSEEKEKSIVRKALVEALKSWSELQMKSGLEELLYAASYMIGADTPEAKQVATLLMTMIRAKVTHHDGWDNTIQLKFLTDYAHIPEVSSLAHELMVDPEVRQKDRIFIFWILIKNNPDDVGSYMNWLFKDNDVFKEIVQWKLFLKNVKKIVGSDRFAGMIHALDPETKTLVVSELTR